MTIANRLGKIVWSDSRPVSRYILGLTCLSCGADCEPVTEGRVVASSECSAIARCTECAKDWHINILVRGVAYRGEPEGRVKRAECGTAAGYARHIKANENACDGCLRAHVDYAMNRRRSLANA